MILAVARQQIMFRSKQPIKGLIDLQPANPGSRWLSMSMSSCERLSAGITTLRMNKDRLKLIPGQHQVNLQPRLGLYQSSMHPLQPLCGQDSKHPLR